MGRTKTNDTSIQYALEDTENDIDNLGFIAGETGPGGVISGTPEWFVLEPNDISDFSAEITNTERSPISKSRQRRKGVTTDLDSTAAFELDMTLSHMQDVVEGFMFANSINGEMDIDVSLVDGTTDEFDFTTALAAGEEAKLIFTTLEFTTLIVGRGFTNSINNGLHALAADATTLAVGVTTDLVDETPPANARIELAGIRFLDALTDLSYAFTGTTGTLTVGAGITVFDWADWGLVPGMYIHIGSLTSADVVQNAFQNVAANDQFGYARIITVAAKVLTLERLSDALDNTAPTVPAVVDIMIGKFTRNLDVDNAEFIERSFQFEAGYPNLGSAGGTEFEYSRGNYCDALSFEFGLADKATMSAGFIGVDTDPPVAAGSRKANASTAKEPLMTAALNTSSQIARLRITDVDESGLTTDFKTLTLVIANEVSPEKVLGRLGAKFMNIGNLLVDIETDILFSNGDVLDRIRNNVTVNMDFALVNDDGTVVFDLPSMDLGGGSKIFPINESIQVSLEGKAFEDPTLNISLGVTHFPAKLTIEP